MNLELQYWGRSGVVSTGGHDTLRFSPNLARPKVFFDSALKHPLRFREAMSALHDVVIGDLRFKKKDKSAYLEWKKQEAERQAALEQQILKEARQQELERLAKEPIPPGLEADFRRLHKIYWDARRRWANELSANDPELFRHLVPCDPVVTVAPDVVFFECFSKDESSYGCLLVDNDAFVGDPGSGLGTTNVDYSLALYDHFQKLRTYRSTRLQVDPSGFEVKVEGAADYREEKIDLPPSWLRGFGQIQSAMALPARKLELSVDVVYGILAHLARHREKTGPRSLRFRLTPGQAPVVVLEPWGLELRSRGAVYSGEKPEEVKAWGRRRLFALARVLPLAERFEVHLLGNGMPSIWIAHLGEMRLVLALSGWTTNDWTSGTNLDLLAGTYRADPRTQAAVTKILEAERSAKLGELKAKVEAPTDLLLGALIQLAKQGQLIYDHAAGRFRFRQVMPAALSESLIGPEPEELTEGRRLAREGLVKVDREEGLSEGRRLVVASVDGTKAEAIFDPDAVFSRAKCGCRHHHKFGLRAGPCRHLLALRIKVQAQSLFTAAAPPGAH